MTHVRTQKFIRDVVLPYQGEACLSWPFSRDDKGYGFIWANGRSHRAARYVCEIMYGTPPSRSHVAAHSCGRGHLGCVNPRHLRWATPEENTQDMLRHGTVFRPSGEKNGRARLTKSDVLAIRELAALPRDEIAARFGVDRSTIVAIIQRRNWRHV